MFLLLHNKSLKFLIFSTFSTLALCYALCYESKLHRSELSEQLNTALSKHFHCYLDKPELGRTLGHFSKQRNTMFFWHFCMGLQTSLKIVFILERHLPPSCNFTHKSIPGTQCRKAAASPRGSLQVLPSSYPSASLLPKPKSLGLRHPPVQTNQLLQNLMFISEFTAWHITINQHWPPRGNGNCSSMASRKPWATLKGQHRQRQCSGGQQGQTCSGCWSTEPMAAHQPEPKTHRENTGRPLWF